MTRLPAVRGTSRQWLGPKAGIRFTVPCPLQQGWGCCCLQMLPRSVVLQPPAHHTPSSGISSSRYGPISLQWECFSIGILGNPAGDGIRQCVLLPFAIAFLQLRPSPASCSPLWALWLMGDSRSFLPWVKDHSGSVQAGHLP